MLLNLSDLSDEPLHRQISRQIRAQILAGHLEAGCRLPSIRETARSHKVSAITVQRAYEDLERAGVTFSRRGKGYFVRELDPAHRRRMAEERARGRLAPVVREILAEGLSPQQVEEIVRGIVRDGEG